MMIRFRLNKLKNTIRSFARNRNISPDTVLSLLVLVVILGILVTNVVRKVEQGRRDYEVYVAEYQTLKSLKSENDQLKAELDYYNSLEYRLLYARDSFNSVRPGENLYELESEVKLYQVSKPPLRVYRDLDLLKVWRILILGS